MAEKYTEAITVKVTEQMLADLSVLAEDEDRPLSNMVRRILVEYINKSKMDGNFPEPSKPEPTKKKKK